MEMSGFLNTLLSSTYFYAALAVVVLLIVYAIYRNGVIKGIKNHLTELDKSFTNINTIPLAFMMNKATALARTNEQAKKVVEEIGPKYQQAISELSGLHELLENSEDYIATKNYKEAKQANQEMGRRLSSVEEIVYEVKDALDSVVKQEQKQRDEINVIKDDFHDVKISFAENSNNYVYSYDALQLNIVEIEKEFSSFEECMYNSNFAKANELKDKIKDDIDELKKLLETLPNLLVLARYTIPKQIEDVNGIYVQTKNKGANLDHLDVEKNIEMVNSLLRLELNNLKEAKIDNCLNNLSDCVVRLNQINEAINKESKAFDNIEDAKTKAYGQLDLLKNILEDIEKTYQKASERFGLDSLDDKIASYHDFLDRLEQVKGIIEEKLAGKKNPSSENYLLIQQLDQDIQLKKDEFTETKRMLDDACMDEKDAKDTLTKLYLIINEIQSCVRKQRLVSISPSYQEDLNTAKQYTEKIEELLEGNPLNMPTLNAYIKEGRDFIYTLFNDVNKILGSARMVEEAIVVANKSRSTYQDINADLTSCEIAYQNGEYTNALKVVFAALDKIYPNQAPQKLKERKK